MNLSLTAHALTSALTTALHPVTVAEVTMRYVGGSHTRNVLENIFDIPADTEIHRAIRRLETLANSERIARERLHYSFDPNRLLALLMQKNALEKALEMGGN